MKHMRISNIYEYIRQKENVSLDELQQKFNVSLNTIRRDISTLISEDKVSKIYGGVCIKSSPHTLVPYNKRNFDNIDAKETICMLAASHILDGDTIFVDSGTTVKNLLKFLKHKQNLTIITHNIYIIFDALEYDNINVYALPGLVNTKTASVLGSKTLKALENFNISKAFFTATGISVNRTVSNAIFPETDIKQQAIKRSYSKYLLVDYSKFDKISMNTFATINQFDSIITDKQPPNAYKDCFASCGCRCLYPECDSPIFP